MDKCRMTAHCWAIYQNIINKRKLHRTSTAFYRGHKEQHYNPQTTAKASSLVPSFRMSSYEDSETCWQTTYIILWSQAAVIWDFRHLADTNCKCQICLYKFQGTLPANINCVTRQASPDVGLAVSQTSVCSSCDSWGFNTNLQVCS
jgi:hypothetical protein